MYVPHYEKEQEKTIIEKIINDLKGKQITFRVIQEDSRALSAISVAIPHYIIEIYLDNEFYTSLGIIYNEKHIFSVSFPDMFIRRCARHFKECINKTKNGEVYEKDFLRIKNLVDCNKVCKNLEGINESNKLEFEVVHNYQNLDYDKFIIIYYLIKNAIFLKDPDNMLKTKIYLEFNPFSTACDFLSPGNLSSINCQSFVYGFIYRPNVILESLLTEKVNSLLNAIEVSSLLIKLYPSGETPEQETLKKKIHKIIRYSEQSFIQKYIKYDKIVETLKKAKEKAKNIITKNLNQIHDEELKNEVNEELKNEVNEELENEVNDTSNNITLEQVKTAVEEPTQNKIAEKIAKSIINQLKTYGENDVKKINYDNLKVLDFSEN